MHLNQHLFYKHLKHNKLLNAQILAKIDPDTDRPQKIASISA